MKYCPDCGSPLERHIVGGEARNHWICNACNKLHYQHPMIVVNGLVAHGDRLLWVQRGIEARKGLWAIPGGFLERGESLAEGCAREVWEEAGVNIAPGQLHLYMTGTLTAFSQLYIAFVTTVDTDDCLPGAESQSCGFFRRDECPWEQMAYPEVNRAIIQAYDDLESGRFSSGQLSVWQTEQEGEGYRLWQVRES